MKKTHIGYSIAAIMILLSGVASAEVSSTGTNKTGELRQKVVDLKQEVKENRDKIKEEIASTTKELKDVKEELKNSIEIKIGKKLDEKKLKVADGFEKSIQNLKDLVARIESRISKMDISGADTSSSKLLLETAKYKLTLAEADLTSLANLLAEDVPAFSTSTYRNNIRKMVLGNVKFQSERTKKSIKTAHGSIIRVIASLKPGQLKEKNSTSTKETESTSTNNY